MALLENQKFSTAAVNMAHSAGYTALHVAVKRGHCHALRGTGSATLSRESCDSKVELAPASCRANPVRTLPLGGANLSANS